MTVVFGFVAAVLLVGSAGMIISAFRRSHRSARLLLTGCTIFYLWIVGDTILPHLITAMLLDGGFWLLAGFVPGVFVTWFFVRKHWSYFMGKPADAN